MDKDALTSVGVIALLLAVIVAATVFTNRQQLVATRPQVNAVVSEALGAMLGIEREAEVVDQVETGTTACPLGCSVNPTPQPAAGQKEQVQADPVPYVRDAVATKFADSLRDGSLETVYSLDTTMWWRSDEGYRIQVPAAKTVTIQVPTTQTAYKLAPAGKDDDTHPALRHPQLASVYKEMTAAMKKLDYKVTKITNCPVDESYDPFNNCLVAYTHKKNDQKCLLIAGYGQYGVPADPTQPYLRLELSCSAAYDNAHALQSPYLYALNIIDPDWLIPDTAVYGVHRQSDSLVQVDFGYRTAYFQEIPKGLTLLGDQADDEVCTVGPDEDGELSLQCL